MNTLIRALLCVSASVLVAAPGSFGQDAAKKVPPPLEERKIDAKLSVFVGNGGNAALLVTDKALFVIDTKMKDPKDFRALAAGRAGSKPIIVINTHFHPDHVGGNALFAGSRIISGAYDAALWKTRNGEAGLPTEWLRDSLVLAGGDETVILLNVGAAHTSNDVVVYLAKRKVLFSGDLIFAGRHPVMDVAGGCNPSRWITVLAMLEKRWPVTTLVPGHGDPGSLAAEDAGGIPRHHAGRERRSLAPRRRAREVRRLRGYTRHGELR